MSAHYKKFKVKAATGIILWAMIQLKWFGWTSNWGVIYLRPEQIDNERLIAHEQVHAMQIQRDGYVWQPIKYAYYCFKYGYENNPYEVEARNG
ncbi:hypothetical protein PH505_bb00590 [Pseudoalteromonas distincta]|uniref:hypothetical protein n=1 Tax=Pseudoalteromonas distincta TaxID=77608 RepID=UPI00020A0FE2|nr:hypothetical protein [Pseudoalteromonas distincta]EGI72911.1 hypothetical protein PH505_bb00590 [Pseudoalteromonas distincta]|tara:strand:+ start:112 stop:390 length:279 start_codon:yes stop_codon:yes gene_type:complete